jgi:hypothetical protein
MIERLKFTIWAEKTATNDFYTISQLLGMGENLHFETEPKVYLSQADIDHKTPIPTLPLEICKIIFSNFSAKDLYRCSLVNKTWYSLANPLIRISTFNELNDYAEVTTRHKNGCVITWIAIQDNSELSPLNDFHLRGCDALFLLMNPSAEIDITNYINIIERTIRIKDLDIIPACIVLTSPREAYG